MTKRSSLVELSKGRWREFRREPSAFFFVLFMPILWMVAFGFGLSGTRQDHYGVGWIPTSASGAEAIRARLAGDEALRVTDGDLASLAPALKRGDVLVTVEVTAVGVRYRYDPSNRESRRARDVVDDAVQKAAGRRDALIADDVETDIAGTRYVDFLVPGLVALTILTTSVFGTGMTLVASRRENLLKRYLATPMRPWEYVLSHVVGRGMILVFELTTVLLAAGIIFHFRIAGRFFDFVVLATLGAAALTALGILLGSRTTNAAAMNGVSNLLVLPMMAFSGVWFSRANLPDWLAAASRWLPLTPLVDGLRRIALEGASLTTLGFEVGLLVAYFVLGTTAAVLAFKWY